MDDLEVKIRKEHLRDAAWSAAKVLHALDVNGKLEQVYPEFFIRDAINKNLKAHATEVEVAEVTELVSDYLAEWRRPAPGA
jgi:hypothetical protein